MAANAQTSGLADYENRGDGSKEKRKRYHVYHAEADLLSGIVEHPVKQPIEAIARLVLANTRNESLRTQSVSETNIEGLISFKRGHTRVIGTQLSSRTDVFGADHSGWVTQSTATLEGYNVVDVITVDRVTAQVSTHHAPQSGAKSAPHEDVPSVNFLGSTFDNLRIGGFEVQVELDLDYFAAKSPSGRPYLLDESFNDRLTTRLNEFKQQEGDYRENSGALAAGYRDLRQKEDSEDAKGETTGYPKRRCSLVKKITLPIPIPGVQIFGSLISIPGFGVVSLAEVEVGEEETIFDTLHRVDDPKPKADDQNPNTSKYFKLTMFKMYLGCPTVGSTNTATAKANGHGGTG